jgi:peptide/nickel transport system substrate-binding protein
MRQTINTVVIALGALAVAACGGSGDGASKMGVSNDLLIIGYDREPDTMNRYATHILEDIESCVVEGLVTNDEQMRIVPVLAAEIPTIENRGVVIRPDGGMDVTWKLRPGVKWHDGTPHTSADVQFTVQAINKGDWKPESVDGFDRITGVDTPDSLTAVVHYKELYAPYQLQFVRGTLPKSTVTWVGGAMGA